MFKTCVSVYLQVLVCTCVFHNCLLKFFFSVGLYLTGIALKLSVSLHNQGVLEQEMITLVCLAPDDPDVQLAQKAALKRANSIKSQKAKIAVWVILNTGMSYGNGGTVCKNCR